MANETQRYSSTTQHVYWEPVEMKAELAFPAPSALSKMIHQYIAPLGQ